MKKNYEGIIFGLMAIFLLTSFTTYVFLNQPEPQAKQQMAAPQGIASSDGEIVDVVFQQGYKACVEKNLGCGFQPVDMDETLQASLKEKSLEEIQGLYPPPQWVVESLDQVVYITDVKAGLCEDHKATKHLGINESQEYLTVFYGPSTVGEEGGVYRVTDIPMANLDGTEQGRISRGEVEFASDDEMNAILDSYSEMFEE